MSVEANSQRKLGYAEYALIPDDGRRHEIIDGEHIVNPAPNLCHQILSRRIQFQLYSQIELRGLGMVFDAPCDVQLSEWDVVQPDLIVVLNHKQAIMTKSRIMGSPDLLVEILSMSSVHNDRVRKLERYRTFAIPEYWIVDPDEHVVEQFYLRNEAYELLGRPTQAFDVCVIADVRVDLGQVW
jgi:Uma2 family endonuclease